jgi:cysteinyl-tRNA synthetase
VNAKLNEYADLIAGMTRHERSLESFPYSAPSDDLIFALSDDLRTDAVESHFDRLAQQVRGKFGGFWAARAVTQLADDLDFLGVDLSDWSSKQAKALGIKVTEISISEQIAARLAFIRDKNWAEADRIRDELLAQGIQLKDGKDPVTGERVTTWEVKR